MKQDNISELLVRRPPQSSTAVPHTTETVQKMETLRRLALSTFNDIEKILDNLRVELYTSRDLSHVQAIKLLLDNTTKVRNNPTQLTL